MGRAHDAEERLAHKMHDGAVCLSHGVGNAAHRAHEAAVHAAHEATLTRTRTLTIDSASMQSPP